MSDTVIVYTNTNDHPIRRILHPDINHCFVAHLDRGEWIITDYTNSGIDVYTSSSLPEGVYYQRVKTAQSCLPKFMTCVGFVKALIGIENPFILTPWQLLKYIEKRFL